MLLGIKMGLRLILNLLGLFSFCRLQMLKAESLKHPQSFYIFCKQQSAIFLKFLIEFN